MGISIYSAEYFKPKYIEYVYSLRNPINNEVFYVGKTHELKYRWKAHIHEAKKECNTSDKCLIIKSILKEGKLPIIREIDRTEIRIKLDEYLAFYREIKWIKFYIEIGWNLTNISAINGVLESTDYYKYKNKISHRTYSDYFYGQDNEGNDVYDLKRLQEEGYKPPKEPPPIPYDWGKYNPYENEKWRKLVGLEPLDYWVKRYAEITLDYSAFNDTNENYYEQNDCSLFY